MFNSAAGVFLAVSFHGEAANQTQLPLYRLIDLINSGRAAEFFQAFAAVVPGLGIEDADVAALVERQAGAGLAPQEDVLRGSLDGARRLPEPGGLVPACGDDALAVGAECGGNHTAFMLQRRAERLSGRAVPQARGLVV